MPNVVVPSLGKKTRKSRTACLASGRLTTDFVAMPAMITVSIPRAKDQLEVSAVEGAKPGLVEKYVVRIDDKPLMKGR